MQMPADKALFDLSAAKDPPQRLTYDPKVKTQILPLLVDQVQPGLYRYATLYVKAVGFVGGLCILQN